MNSVSSLQRLGRDVIGDIINSSMSSVNRPHLWICEQQVTTWILGLKRMAITNVSIAMVNIRGHPCLVPLTLLRGFEYCPWR